MTDDHGVMIFCKTKICSNHDQMGCCKIRELWIGGNGKCTRIEIPSDPPDKNIGNPQRFSYHERGTQ